MAMDWDKFRIFHMVAKAGSFTGAGETLNLSQSAVSRHISSFEEELGIPLFHRHARGLVLTEKGEMLYKASIDIFARMIQIEGQMIDAREGGHGPLSVTMPEFLATSWFVPLIPQFHHDHQDILLTLLLDDRIFNLTLREADVALRLHEPEQADLIQSRLGSFDLCVCAHRDYLAEHGAPQTPCDLRDHICLAYPDQSLVPFKNPNDWLLRAGVDVAHTKNLILINSLSAIAAAVQSGAGIATLPSFMIDPATNPDMVTILPELRSAPITIYFVYQEERRHSKRIGALRDYLIRQLKLNPMTIG